MNRTWLIFEFGLIQHRGRGLSAWHRISSTWVWRRLKNASEVWPRPSTARLSPLNPRGIPSGATKKAARGTPSDIRPIRPLLQNLPPMTPTTAISFFDNLLFLLIVYYWFNLLILFVFIDIIDSFESFWICALLACHKIRLCLTFALCKK